MAFGETMPKRDGISLSVGAVDSVGSVAEIPTFEVICDERFVQLKWVSIA